MENNFITNFQKLLENVNYTTNTDLFIKLYKIAYSKRNIEKISSKLFEPENKSQWILLFNKITQKIKPIDKSFLDIQNSTFNNFAQLYNHLYELLQPYFIIIKNIDTNQYINVNFLILENNDSVYNIENIYSLIENTNRTVNKKNILLTYHDEMVLKQKTKKMKREEANGKTGEEVKNESKYDYALNSTKNFLIKVRRLRLSMKRNEDTLKISELFYNLRKCVQVLVLLKHTIKYYYKYKNNVINENLRLDLLTLIKTLQGSISRSNELNNEKKETERIKIRNAFKRRFLNTLNNENDFIYNIPPNIKNKAIALRESVKGNLDIE